MLVQRIVRSTKARLLSDEPRYRRVRWGIARGCHLPIRLRSQLRLLVGLYEIEIAPYVVKLVVRGATCFDIGAAHGYYTAALARLSDPGRVVAFEPQDDLFTWLQETVRRNAHLTSKITLYRKPVGSEPSSTMTTLDALAGGGGGTSLVPHFIKIDVDGLESAVLRGAEEVLARHRPRLIVEVHSAELERQCVTILSGHRYRHRIVDQQRVWPELRPIALNRWLIAVHDEDDAAQWLGARR